MYLEGAYKIIFLGCFLVSANNFWLAKTSNKPISLTTWLAINLYLVTCFPRLAVTGSRPIRLKVCAHCKLQFVTYSESDTISGHLSRRLGTCDRKSTIHLCNLWVRGSNLTSGSQPAKLPSFGGYSLETLPYLATRLVDNPYL